MQNIQYTPENLGKHDPQYGGVLTDVSTLPVGTRFFVCNGGWHGKIIRIENKTHVKPVGHRAIPIDAENTGNNILALSEIKYPEKS